MHVCVTCTHVVTPSHDVVRHVCSRRRGVAYHALPPGVHTAPGKVSLEGTAHASRQKDYL